MAARYFTNQINGDEAYITGSDAAHLARVLRAKPGEVLTLCDGANTDYQAEIASVAPEEIVLRVLSHSPSLGEPSLKATVFIGYARGERMDWAVQKSVELGAAGIVPFYCERCVVKPSSKDENKAKRLERIAHEAAKQCKRGILPAVEPPVSFNEMLDKAATAEQSLFFYEEGGQPLRQAFRPDTQFLSLITGPEGGFTPSEAAAARSKGCIPIGLGPRILRSETAPAAALAALMTLSGNLE